MLKKLEMELYDEYKQASQEVRQKLIDYLKAFKEKDKIKRQLLKNGQITKQQYNDWRIGQIAIGKRWRELQKTLAKDFHNRNKIAKSIVDGYTPEAYALNHNYATFQVEKGALVDTSYTLYDRQTVERLFRDDPDLLPPRKLNAQKDLSWNRQKIQSVAIQAILQGESIPKIATRLAEAVGDSNYKSAVRNARTMMTSAENAGRQNAYNRAHNMGIKLKKTWVATFDGRTRHTHRQMDGITIPIDDSFPNGCKNPGDPKGPPEEVYNCRCTTIAQIEGFERDITDPNIRNMDKLKYVSYDQWKADKQYQMKEYVKSRAKPTTFKTRDDADKYLRPLLDKDWGNLTDTEKYGIWKYTENSNPLNKPLSGYEGSWARTSFKGVGQTNWGVEDAWRKIPQEFSQFGHSNGRVDHARAVAAATRAIDKYELQKDMTLVRGSDNYGLAGLFEGDLFSYDTALEILNSGDAHLIKEAFVGQTFVNHAFTSTGVAADAGFSGNVSYRIFAPKGTHCLYAEPQSAWGNTVGDEHDPTSVRPRLYEPGTQKNKEEIGWEAEIIVQRGTEYRVTGIAMHGKNIQIDMEIVSQPDYFASGYEQTANNGATKFRHRSR